MLQEGSQHNPIDLLDDDQELRLKEEKVTFERNRQSLYQAHMGSQFDVLAAIIKLDIKGTEEQKNRVLKSRILKFFNHGAKSINVQSENFRKRRQPNYSDVSTTALDDTLIIYGVDFLNQKQVKQKFAGLNVNLKWLDDSHCQVNFQNSEDARKGLEMNLLNKNEDTVKIQNEDLEIPRGWFELQSYNYMTLPRRLFARYGASNESDLQIQKSNDYHMYQEAKRKFEEQLREEVTEVRYFEVMKKYKLINEDKQRERQTLRRNRDNRDGRDGRDQGFRERNQYRDRNNDRDRNYDRRVDRDGNWQKNRDSEGRFNNYNRNRDYGNRNNYNDRGEGQRNRYNRQDERDRSREKRAEQSKNDELDNLSIISKPKSIAGRRERRFSQSICSNSPVRQNNQGDDDAKSSYSFILNLEEEGNSNQIVNNFNNLTINEDQEQPNFSRKQMKQQEINYSIVEDNNEYPRKTDPNVSLNLNQSVVSRRKPDLNLSLNLLNDSTVSKKKAINTSIVEDSIEIRPPKKLNLSIEQITIYD